MDGWPWWCWWKMKMNMMMMMKNKKVIDCLWWRRWWSCWRGGGWLSLHFFTKSRMEFYPNGCAATKKDFTPSIGSAKTWSETKPEISPGFRVNVFVLGFKCAWKTLESVPFCLGNWICWFYGFDFCWWVSIRFHGLSLWLCVCAMVDRFPAVSSLMGRLNPFLVLVEKTHVM